VIQPTIRNHQWLLMFGHSRHGLEQAVYPPDEAPVRTVVTPPMPADAHLIGLSDQPGVADPGGYECGSAR